MNPIIFLFFIIILGYDPKWREPADSIFKLELKFAPSRFNAGKTGFPNEPTRRQRVQISPRKLVQSFCQAACLAALFRCRSEMESCKTGQAIDNFGRVRVGIG